MRAQFTVPVRELRALAMLTSSDTTRPYLGGVLCEVRPQSVVMVATNGHLLGAALTYRTPYEPGENVTGLPVTSSRAGEWLIPGELAARLPKNVDGYVATITIDGDAAAEHGAGDQTDQPAELRIDGARFAFRTLPGRFPDWRRVANIRDRAWGSAAQFDPAYVALWAKFAAVFTGSRKSKPPRVLYGHNGPDKCAIISIANYENFIGLLMPVRTDPDDIKHHAPNWAIDSDWRDETAAADTAPAPAINAEYFAA